MEKKKLKIYHAYLPETMHGQAQLKADSLGLSFAAYVRLLLAKDLA